ncbi:MAG: class I SAM-dependent methyltransferase, partial [Chloroflexi bacterium]|nr:class I SAM-dependent methyltransferase [Chloroflexota bacterium]
TMSTSDIPYWWEDPDPERALAKYLRSRDNPYGRWKSWSVRKLIPLPGGERLALDYGCGGGEFTVYLAELGWRVVAADASLHALNACRVHVQRTGQENRVTFVEASPPDYWKELHGQHFELILAKDVIEHIQDDIRFLIEVRKHLSPRGIAVVVTQNDYSWNFRLQAPTALAENPTWCGWDPTHVRFYNVPTLRGKLAYAGLEPIKWRSAYLIPYMAWKWKPARLFRQVVERTLGPGAFYVPERLLGSCWPFYYWGWSLAVVCRVRA